MTELRATGGTPDPGSPPGAGASPVAGAPAAGDVPARPSAPAEHGWWRLLLALAAFLLVPASPLRAALPIEHTFLLLVTALAACTLVGWWAGGRFLLALAWVLAAGWMLAHPAASGALAYDRLVRGWAALLAASFGLVCVFGRGRALFGRALSALGITLVLALVLMATGSTTPGELRAAVQAELGARADESVAAMRAQTGTPEWQRFVQDYPGAASLAADSEQQARLLVRGGSAVFPALLALESLMALGLAWSLYHRVSRTRIGPPLARVRDFRFNDQLVWGLIVGLVIVLLPSLASLRPLGFSLLVFFGALYALRGFGVLAWFLAPERLGMALLIGLALVLPPLIGALSLGLGLGDTWADWRTRGARPTP